MPAIKVPVAFVVVPTRRTHLHDDEMFVAPRRVFWAGDNDADPLQSRKSVAASRRLTNGEG